MHLVQDQIYLNVKFLSWTSSGGGGGFSYERSTVPEPSTLALLAAGGIACVPLSDESNGLPSGAATQDRFHGLAAFQGDTYP